MKKILILATLLLAAIPVFARQVDLATAQEKAQQFKRNNPA